MENRRYEAYGFPKARYRSTVCAVCGYRFERGDSVYNVKETGDLIHTDCWEDYFEENEDSFVESIEI